MMALSRGEQMRTLAAGVDVLVIGGGITGAGVAADAATRGYRVGLVDQADFAGGTSSRSTKLVHGGIRYLPQGHIGLVRQGLRERSRLLRLAPHLVRPLPFVIPLYAGVRRPLGVRVPGVALPLLPLGLRAGLLAYDLFARAEPALRHRVVARETIARELPDLRVDGLRAALIYHDAGADDVRLTHAVLATARAHGAVTINHAKVVDFTRSGDRVTGARVEDRLTGRVHEVTARFVVNAAGIWGERVAALERSPAFRIRHSKGAHVVLRAGAVRLSTALVIPETDDGRLAFIVPWAGRPLLGTTDTPYDGDLESPDAAASDVAYLLQHANRYLRRAVRVEDVTAAWAGIRPLVAAAAAASTAGLSRDHVVSVSAGGVVSIVGGKLTSYRHMAEDAVDAIVARDGGGRPCRTADLMLAGADGLDAARADLAASSLAADQQAHLLEAYGSGSRAVLGLVRSEPQLGGRLEPDLPVSGAEVVHAVRSEQAVTLTDVMFLRTRLAAVDESSADDAVEAVAGIMARALEWDQAEVRRQRDAYAATAERERRWREPRLSVPAN
jgi:glycerol-3-phosphate dehydrogenase